MKSSFSVLVPAVAIATSNLLLCSSAMAGLSARDIMVQSEQARKIHEVTANCRLVEVSGGSHHETKTKTFRWWRKMAGNGVDYNTLVRFLTPATVRGEGILINEKDGGENEVLLYLPVYKKIRRVENQEQTGRFMGSEFSYSDIATPHVGDYTYSGGKLIQCPKDSKARGLCYEVESKPANKTVSERTGYSRIVNWVSRTNSMVVKAEFYDAHGALYKRLIAWDIRQAPHEKGHWIAHRTKITNIKTGGSSTIEFSGIKIDSRIPNSTFTRQNLSAE